MDEDYVIKQLSQKKLKQVSFGSNGNGITYSNMTAIREAMEAAKIEGVSFTTSPNPVSYTHLDVYKRQGTAVLLDGDFWNVRFKNQLAKSTLMRLLEIDVKETEDFPTASQS